jgi:hypothetical protein
MSNADRIEELRSKYEENPRRYFAPLANEFRKAGDLAQAIAICREHLPKQPGHMSGYIVFGQTLYEAGTLDEARSVFEQALALDPENLIALKHLGDIARIKGENSVARRWYERVLDADPRNDDIASQLAALSMPTPPLAMPAIETPVSFAAPMQPDDASGVFRSFDPSSLLDIPENVISGNTSHSEWAPRPTSTPRPTPTHEPIDLDFPDDPEPVGSGELEEEFEEGLIAPEWPDTSELVARVTTPVRAETPLSVPVTADAVAAFGREDRDVVAEPADRVVSADLELDDSFVDAYVPLGRESSSPVEEPAPVTMEAESATVEPTPVTVKAASVTVEASPTERESMSVQAAPAAMHPELAPIHPELAPIHPELAPMASAAALMEAEPAPSVVEPAPFLQQLFIEPVVEASPPPVAVQSDECSLTAELPLQQLDSESYDYASDYNDLTLDERESLTGESFAAVAPESVLAPVETFAELTPDDAFAAVEETERFDVEKNDSAIANEAQIESLPAVSEEESFASINPEAPVTHGASDGLFNEVDDESAFANNPIFQSAFAPVVEDVADEHDFNSVQNTVDGFALPESFADVTADGTMETLSEIADVDDSHSELLLAAATAENAHEEVAAVSDEAIPALLDPEPLLHAEEPSPSFVTETMAELLVSQGFVPRAIEIYEELVRRHAYDPVLSARLEELRSEEFQQSHIQHNAEIELAGELDNEELLPQDTAYYASDVGHVQSFTSAVPTPRFSTPLRSTPLYFTPVGATPIASAIVAEPVSASPLRDEAIPYRTARDRFAELARRRVTRRTPTHATAIADDSAEGLSSLFGSALPTTPDELAARALADAFGPVQDSGESLFDLPESAAPVAPLRSFTPLSTASIHVGAGANAEQRGERPASQDYSFDRFFPDPAMTSNTAASASTFPLHSAGPTPPPSEDLAQFSAWLKGLNNA